MKYSCMLIGMAILLILLYTEGQRRIDTYNEGYRLGRLHAVQELVECEGDNTPYAVQLHSHMIRLLHDKGELSTTPYPCTE